MEKPTKTSAFKSQGKNRQKKGHNKETRQIWDVQHNPLICFLKKCPELENWNQAITHKSTIRINVNTIEILKWRLCNISSRRHTSNFHLLFFQLAQKEFVQKNMNQFVDLIKRLMATFASSVLLNVMLQEKGRIWRCHTKANVNQVWHSVHQNKWLC